MTTDENICYKYAPNNIFMTEEVPKSDIPFYSAITMVGKSCQNPEANNPERIQKAKMVIAEGIRGNMYTAIGYLGSIKESDPLPEQKEVSDFFLEMRDLAESVILESVSRNHYFADDFFKRTNKNDLVTNNMTRYDEIAEAAKLCIEREKRERRQKGKAEFLRKGRALYNRALANCGLKNDPIKQFKEQFGENIEEAIQENWEAALAFFQNYEEFKGHVIANFHTLQEKAENKLDNAVAEKKEAAIAFLDKAEDLKQYMSKIFDTIKNNALSMTEEVTPA